MKDAWLSAVWLALAGWMYWWLQHNPLPDGYQNEYLHVDMTYNLWGAVCNGDIMAARGYMYREYWPWGFYAVPWPMMATLGATHQALVSSNLIHLAVLLWAMRSMGKLFQAPLAPLLVVLCPGVFGCLVRFEPNVANVAWTAAGVACLLQSRRLRDLGPSVGWGACLGVGLMMDRLSVLFFLVPAVAPLLFPLDRRVLRNLAAGLGTALFFSAAYYREFFMRHTDELLSQASVGEIDSAGTVGAGGSWLYYPMALVDSQAGPLIGGLMLGGGVLAAWRGLRRRGDPSMVLLAAVVPAMIFFTLISKQQVYYTLPILGPLAVLAGRHGLLSWLGVIGGLWSFLAVGVGVVPGGPWLPESWVSPRHTIARPPSNQQWPLEEAFDALSLDAGDRLLVFSEDPTLFEGFVLLKARESLPGVLVYGVTLNPQGSHEFLPEADGLLWVGGPSEAWPRAQRIRAELVSDHQDLTTILPIDTALVDARERFSERGRWPSGDLELVVFQAR